MFSLLLQLTPPPDTGTIDRWVIYVLAACVSALFLLVIKQNADALKKADTRGDKWEATANKATDESYEANRTIGRAINTLERQGVLMEAQAKDLATVKADSVDLKRILASVEQEVRGLRDAAHRRSGDD